MIDSRWISSISAMVNGTVNINNFGNYYNSTASAALNLTQALIGQSVPQYPFFAQLPKCCSRRVTVTANATNTQAGEITAASGDSDVDLSATTAYSTLRLQIQTNDDGTYQLSLLMGIGALITAGETTIGGFYSQAAGGVFGDQPVWSPTPAAGSAGGYVISPPIAAADLLGTHTWSLSGSNSSGRISAAQALTMEVAIG